MHPYLLLFYILFMVLLHLVCNYSARQPEKGCSPASGGRHGSSSATSRRTKGLNHLNEGDEYVSFKRRSAKKSKASSPCEDFGLMSCRSKTLLTERDIKAWRLTVARYADDAHGVDCTVPTHRRRKFQPNRFSPFAYSSDEEDQDDVCSPSVLYPSRSSRFCGQRNKLATSFEPPKESIHRKVPTSPSIIEREKWRRWNQVIDEVEEARRQGKLEEYAAKRRGEKAADEPPQRSQEIPTNAPLSVMETKPEDVLASSTIPTGLEEPRNIRNGLCLQFPPLNSAADLEAEAPAGIDRLEKEKEELALQIANATSEPGPWRADPPAGSAKSMTDGPPQEANGSDETDALAPKGPQENQSPGDQGAQGEVGQPHSEHEGATSVLENNQVEELPSNFGSPFDEPSEIPVITTGPEPAPSPVDPPSAPVSSGKLVTDLPPQEVNVNDKTNVPDPKDLQDSSNSSTDQGKLVDTQSSSVDADELAKAIEDELAASDDSDLEDVTTPPDPPGTAHVIIAEQAPATDLESPQAITCVEKDVNMDSMLETSFDSRTEKDESKAPMDSKENQGVDKSVPSELSVPETDEDMVDVSLLDLLDLEYQSSMASLEADSSAIESLLALAFLPSVPEQDDAMPIADMQVEPLDAETIPVSETKAIEMTDFTDAQLNLQVFSANTVVPVQRSLESEILLQHQPPQSAFVTLDGASASKTSVTPPIDPTPATEKKDIPAIIAPPIEPTSVAVSESIKEEASTAPTPNPPQSLREEPTLSVAMASSDLLVQNVVPSAAPTKSADKAVAPGPVASSSARPSVPSAGTSKSIWSRVSFVPLQVPNRPPAVNGSPSTPSSSASTASAASTSIQAPATTMESIRSQVSMEPIVPRVVSTKRRKAIAGRCPTQLAVPSTSTTPSQEAAAATPSTSKGPSAADKVKGREENADPDPSVPPIADADIDDGLKTLLLAADTYSKTLQSSQTGPSAMLLDGNGLAPCAEVSPSLQVILDELDRIKAMATPDEKSNGTKNDAESASTQDTLPRSGDTVLDPSGASLQIHPRLTSDNIKCWYPIMMDENERYEDRMIAASMLSGDDTF